MQGDTALLMAVHNASTAAVDILLAAGADPNRKNQQGHTPLGKACAFACLPVVASLLAAGADPNAISHGCTPCYIAAREGNVEVLLALVAAGGDATAPGAPNGDTPAVCATGAARTYLEDPLTHDLRRITAGTCLPEAEAAIRAALLADLGEYAEITAVAATSNASLGEAFVASARKVRLSGVPPWICFLWHGCPSEVLDAVVEDGFRIQFSNLVFNV